MRFSPLRLLKTFAHRVFRSLPLSLFLLTLFTQPALAWDIWLVTNQNRILVIRDIDTSPHQEYLFTHQAVPDAYAHDFGDIAFAPNGRLYGISMTLGRDSQLYLIDTTSGAIATAGTFPFEWGNALYFDKQTGRGYTGGGLQSWSPYRLLSGFYAFDNLNPTTAFLWHDMRPTYPNGGFTGDYTQANGHLYAIWGQGNNLHHATHLLEITTDTAQNPIDATDLGIAENQGVPEGIWGLASNGQHLYAISPTALYRVHIANNTATYTKVLNFDLHSHEVVNGAATRYADLSITLTASNTTPTLHDTIHLTATLHNAGPYDAEKIVARITLPDGYTLVQTHSSMGIYTPSNSTWQLPSLIVGQTATLTLTVTIRHASILKSTAEITAANTTDPDSNTATGFNADDGNDGVIDDDEASVQVIIAETLPQTGFPQSDTTYTLPSSPRTQIYTKTDIVLEIPSLGIKAPIQGVPFTTNGWNTSWLDNTVGWLEGTAFPTWEGNTVLAGHVWRSNNTPGIFSNLKQLRFNDKIYLHAWGHTYVYAVRENTLLSPTDTTTALHPQTLDWLTLLTCEDYQPNSQIYRYRRIVRAVLVGRHD